MLKWAAIGAGVIVAIGAALAINVWSFKPITIDVFYTRVFAKFAFDRPEMLSSMRLLPAWADFYSHKLDDVSPAFDQKSADQFRKDLETLHRHERAALTPEAQLSYDVLEYFLRIQAEGDRFRLHEFPVTQLGGVHPSYPKFMVHVHEVANERDARNYVARLRAFPIKIEQTLENLKMRERQNIVPPRFTLDHVLAQITSVAAVAPRDNPLYVSFKDKLDKIPDDALSATTRQRLLVDAERALTEQVYPAYRRMSAYVASLQAKVVTNDGAWSLPDGVAYYAWCVRRHTTTDKSPEELHALGLAEVERIGAEMDAILKSRGLVKGSVGARTLQLTQDPSQLYENSTAGKQAVLARYQQILDEVNRGVGAAFDLRPRLGVVVQAVPKYAQDGEAAAYYREGSFDGLRPSVFFVNLRDTRETPKFAMRTVAYHEGIPGHHFQIGIAQELRGVPFFRRMIPFTAYSEGCAPRGWWSIPAFTRSAGHASRRSRS